jgi:hypothetical protein
MQGAPNFPNKLRRARHAERGDCAQFCAHPIAVGINRGRWFLLPLWLIRHLPREALRGHRAPRAGPSNRCDHIASWGFGSSSMASRLGRILGGTLARITCLRAARAEARRASKPVSVCPSPPRLGPPLSSQPTFRDRVFGSADAGSSRRIASRRVVQTTAGFSLGETRSVQEFESNVGARLVQAGGPVGEHAERLTQGERRFRHQKAPAIASDRKSVGHRR